MVAVMDCGHAFRCVRKGRSHAHRCGFDGAAGDWQQEEECGERGRRAQPRFVRAHARAELAPPWHAGQQQHSQDPKCAIPTLPLAVQGPAAIRSLPAGCTLADAAVAEHLAPLVRLRLAAAPQQVAKDTSALAAPTPSKLQRGETASEQQKVEGAEQPEGDA